MHFLSAHPRIKNDIVLPIRREDRFFRRVHIRACIWGIFYSFIFFSLNFK